MCLLCLGLLAADARAFPMTEKELQEIFDALIKIGPHTGRIAGFTNPTFMSVHDAGNAYEDTDMMFLVAYPTEIRIYPRAILVWHQVINERIEGHGYCVSYSPLSGTFAAYDSRVENADLFFDVDFRLAGNNNILTDRNTGSLWLQLGGLAFEGALAGRGLKLLPVISTDWQHARKAFPNAKIMSRPRDMVTRAGDDPYGSYQRGSDTYYQNDVIYHPLKDAMDRRLRPKTQILGLELENLSFAVDLEALKKMGAANFFLGPYPLLAVYDDAIGTVRVYRREVWGQPALFRKENRNLIDIESDSVWNMDGTAIKGNLLGASLEPLFGVYAFWFAWRDLYPETLLVPGQTVVPESALQKMP
jgi:hypothetical protein